MKTYTSLRDFVENPRFEEQRRDALGHLDLGSLDTPIVDVIEDFRQLDYCFTLQSCYGHFLHDLQVDLKNTEPLPHTEQISEINYRIAYLALCIRDDERGRQLLMDLGKIPSIDSAYIQLGCADWFWAKQINSFVMQVEPERFKTKDEVMIGYQEAIRIEQTRNRFFDALGACVRNRR